MTALLVFPQDIPSEKSSTGVERCGGMELRDWFAGQYVTGGTLWAEPLPFLESEHMSNRIARQAYELADAMLAARQKT